MILLFGRPLRFRFFFPLLYLAGVGLGLIIGAVYPCDPAGLNPGCFTLGLTVARTLSFPGILMVNLLARFTDKPSLLTSDTGFGLILFCTLFLLYLIGLILDKIIISYLRKKQGIVPK